MDAPLRYSDRQRLADRGTLGPVVTDTVPDEFITALLAVMDEGENRYRHVGLQFKFALARHCRQHFGKGDAWFPSGYWLNHEATTEDVLDFVEILVEEATKPYSFVDTGTFQAFGDIEDRLNRLFARHRFGYRLEAGTVRRVGSPALDEYIVVPALQAVHRPGWEEAERSFREALHHQRGGPDERDDALTAATAALEAALKAAGLKGDRLSALAKDLRNSGLVPGQLQGVPEALDTLLKRSGAIRDPLSDAHGKAPGAEDVPAELVDLSIYWTGAFINYLSAATS